MKHSLLAATLAIGLAAPALSAEDAKERGGGGGSSAMDRAPSSSSSGHSSSSSSSGSSGGSSSTYSSSSNNGSSTAAENRHPRPGTGHGFRSRGGSSYYPYYYPYSYGGYSYYGYPYYYGYWSYDPFYARPYGHYAYGSRTAHDYGALRVLVEPAKARVYVDGYYAGVADDFDGIFQRLSVSPGRHEITLKLEGYRTHRVRLYLPVDRTVKLRYDMVKGAGEDLDDQAGPADPEPDIVVKQKRDDQDEDAERERPRRGAAAATRDVGTLRLHVTPEDASVYVDGRFRGTSRQLDDLLLPSGRHHVEVVRPGYRTFDQDVDVAEEQPTNVQVALDKL